MSSTTTLWSRSPEIHRRCDFREATHTGRGRPGKCHRLADLCGVSCEEHILFIHTVQPIHLSWDHVQSCYADVDQKERLEGENMQAERYFGTLCRFNYPFKERCCNPAQADNPMRRRVRDRISNRQRGVHRLDENRFRRVIGFLDAELSRQLSILAARVEPANLVVVRRVRRPSRTRPLLGPVAIICYDSNLDQAF